MALDPSISLNVKPLEVANPFTQFAQVTQLQGAQQANRLNDMKMAEYERARTEEEGIRNYLASKELSAPETRNGLMQFGKTGLEYSKALSEQDKSNAALQEAKLKNATSKVALFRDALADVKTPQQAAAWITAQHQDPDLKPIVGSLRPLDQALAAIPTNPKDFADWTAKNALGMTKYIERNTMTLAEKSNLGVAQGNLKVAQDREARLAQGPMGTTLTPEQNDALFGENGAVARGAINPNKINSRNAKMWADAFLKNPSADPVKVAQDITAADKAIKDFGTGPQGVKVVAFNTAIDHLDTLDKLGAALKGGDIKAFNSIANTLGIQAGQPAATMYNQAARIVGGEISKAIVPGVGTGKEREEAAAAFNSAMSPDQLAGASATAKKLLGGQLSSLEAQYTRTTKRKDFADQFLSPAARAAYQSGRPAPAVPAAATNAPAIKFLGFEPSPAQ